MGFRVERVGLGCTAGSYLRLMDSCITQLKAQGRMYIYMYLYMYIYLERERGKHLAGAEAGGPRVARDGGRVERARRRPSIFLYL
jgi:hypothetical protein